MWLSAIVPHAAISNRMRKRAGKERAQVPEILERTAED
jgi:hypothetical protein